MSSSDTSDAWATSDGECAWERTGWAGKAGKGEKARTVGVRVHGSTKKNDTTAAFNVSYHYIGLCVMVAEKVVLRRIQRLAGEEEAYRCRPSLALPPFKRKRVDYCNIPDPATIQSEPEANLHIRLDGARLPRREIPVLRMGEVEGGLLVGPGKHSHVHSEPPPRPSKNLHGLQDSQPGAGVLRGHGQRVDESLWRKKAGE